MPTFKSRLWLKTHGYCAAFFFPLALIFGVVLLIHHMSGFWLALRTRWLRRTTLGFLGAGSLATILGIVFGP